MSSDDLSQAISDQDNKILAAQSVLDTVLAEVFLRKKELLELSEVARKGKYNLARLRVERRILESSFWASRRMQ